MILKKLYTLPDPERFFKPVEFVPGFNFIFGKKEFISDPKESLNGIGKSAFLELIDFALLSSFKKNEGKRIYDAYQKGILKGVSVALEFEVDGIIYIIIRSFDKPRIISFSEANSNPVEYYITDLSEKLCNLIFNRPGYPGHFENTWLRQLIPFFIKIQFSKDHKFTDPIKYLKQARPVQLPQYHFFFMDIDNTLANINYQIQEELRKIEPALEEIQSFLLEEYKLNDIGSTEDKINNLKLQIDDLQKGIDNFKLRKNYENDENRANILTQEIKQLWFGNNNDQKKIENYLSSFNLETTVSTNKVKELYAEFGLIADKIKKSLDDVIEFRKSLIKSRKEFLKDEIDRLKNLIQERTSLINTKEEERSKIYSKLSKKNAIKDLTTAYNSINSLKDELGELEARIRSYRQITKKKIEIQKREKTLESEILDFKEKISSQQFEISRYISDIYHRLYADATTSSVFSINTKFDSQAKFYFSILESSKMLSTGRNQGRTLIYDLTILFHAIEKGFKLPRFLIHDGIFNEMDKTHLIELYKFLNEKKEEGLNFQYILTLNEEGHLTENFGDSDLLTPEKIKEKAILVLTPYDMLFKTKYE